MQKPFKICTTCGRRWENIGDMVRDPTLYVNGYQASFEDSREGLFLLTHNVAGCGTTLALKAGKLMPLYGGPKYSVNMAFAEGCEGHCFDLIDASACQNDCAMRWVLEILQILKAHGPEEKLITLMEAGYLDAPAGTAPGCDASADAA